MKKALIPILAVIAVAAIVLCFVFNGQKADLEKSTKNLFNQETVDTKVNEAVEAAKANLFDQEAVDAKVTEAVDAAKAEFETVKGELEGKVADLEAKAAGLFDQEAIDAKVNEAVEAAKGEFETVKGELEDKVADLEAKVAGMFDQEAVDAKVNEAVEAAKGEFETVKGELEGKVADLEAKVAGMFDQDAVDAKVNEAVEAAKAEFETVKGELEGKVAELEGKVAELEGKVAELEAAAAAPAVPAVEEPAPAEDASTDTAVMDHAAYVAAAVDDPVCVETYVQATQSWWDGKLTVYAQSEDGAYFIYNMACASQEDADALVPGTKIRVNGFKSEWSGEVEIIDATYEILDAEDAFIATAQDLTAVMGDEKLIDHQNELFSIKGAKVAAYNDAAFSYAWDGSGSHEGNSDLYFNVEIGGAVYTFTVESYLCGNTTDVYAAVEGLQIGDVIDLEGYLYWYNGANPHIISVVKAAE